ncbi:hypothetical protein ABDK56_09365 [Sphingomonas sp. ASV193]|uniref:hypothetical protein n=1 Tax=Sphingomonas sp. ASV193 TaxID=3144405 RepID=UPI0032E8E569
MNRMKVKRIGKTVLVVGVAALALGVAGASYARAADPTGGNAAALTGKTPQGWSYDVKDGKRVPKASRTTNADGSWREETKQGNCTTVKESSASGEIKTTRSCN